MRPKNQICIGKAKSVRLDKEQSRQRWTELRSLWNEFDPIGVVGTPGGPEDEYEMYVGPTMRLLEQGADVEELTRYFEWVVCERIGLEFNQAAGTQFAERLQRWFNDNWLGTGV
jgi:hypothetical protein